jgi:acyl transferase domain-containing protein
MEAAAGIAGLLKVALSLQHGEIPPHLHFRNPSPKIPWQELPIQIVTSRRDWPRTETPRIAGVSAFGFSGTNAHVVLEEAPRPVVASGAPVDVHVMRVAARSDVAFRELAHRYADHVAAHQEDSLADICHTANTGRGDGAERGAVVAANRAELVAGLRLLAASESGPGVFRGRAAERRRIDPGVSGIADRRARLEGIAAAYVEGIVIDWASLETTGSRRKVVLPAYPWQRQRFWPSSTPAPATPASTGGSDPCAGWTYEIAWQETSTTPGTSVLTSGVALEQRMEPHLRSLRADAAMARYAAAFARLEQRAADGARAALERLAADPAASVVDAYRPLRQRLADIAASSAAEGAEPLDAVIARHPEAETEFRILDRCIAALPDVMEGRRDPLNVLFPTDGASSVAYLYAESPAARVMNELLAALFGEAAAMPAPRVLEVGAGTGGTTSAVLQALSPVNPAEYVFTDVSPAFFALARERFAGVASLRTARLDITAPPVEQGFARGSADVVIAANVLHATPDLGRCLDHVAQLLSPGGVLVLQEWVGVSPAIDLIFGLTPGWWRFADRDLRPAHPLLPADRWRALLEAHGFEDVATLTVAPGDAGVLGRQAVLVARRKAVAARHVILGNPEGAGDRLREALIARGDEAMLVEPAQAAAEVAAAGAAHLIDLRALDTLPADDLAPATAERAAERLSADLVTLVQSLARIGAACPITIATRGALSAGGDSVDGAAQSPLWGIGRVIALEHPEIAPRLVDLDPAADPVEGLLQTLAADAAESQVAVRQGRALVPRLRPHTPVHRPAPLQFDSRGAYVISGGFGGLGLALADWLGRKGAGTVVLLGRRDPSPDAVHAIHAIGQRGTSVLPRTIDATDLDAISECLAGLRASGLRIAGVFHAAGILDDGVLLQVDGARLAAALKPKVQGAWVLHEATRGDRLDAFVLFSAATSMFGSAGQASHAAANAFLDSFAAYRRAAGLPGLSINWGAWSGIGAAAAADVAARVRMKGLQAIDPARGLAILERLMQGAAAQVGVFAADWNAIPASMKAARFVADVVGSAAAPAQTSAAGTSGAVDEWHRVPAHRRRAALSDHVRHEIRRVLGLDAAAAVDMKEGLFEIGFDSLSSMDLRTRLQDTCGCVLPATLAFDCPTPDAIVAHLMPLVFPASPAQSDEAAELLSRKLAELRESLG